MPIYGNKNQKIFSQTKKASGLNIVIKHPGLKFHQVLSNDDPRMTTDLFYYKVKFADPYS